MIIYIKDRYFSEISNLKHEFREVGRKRRASNIYKLVNRKLKKDKDNKEKEDKKKKRKKSKSFSDRDIVPRDIALKGKKEGVVQKDQNGDWRIISYKTNPPEFWDAHYDSKEDAEKALGAYHAQKHYSSYDGISDDNLDDEVYRRAVKKYTRRTKFWKALGGGLIGAGLGYMFGKYLPQQNKSWNNFTNLRNRYPGGRYIHGIDYGISLSRTIKNPINIFKPIVGTTSGSIYGGVLGGLSGALLSRNKEDFMKSNRFKKILKKEYEKAYKNRPHLTNQSDDDSDEEDYENYQQ